jgi:hypothetical protein
MVEIKEANTSNNHWHISGLKAACDGIGSIEFRTGILYTRQQSAGGPNA